MNLCVLAMYDETHSACALAKQIASEPQVQKLYYTESPEQIIKGDPVDLTVSFYTDPADTSRTE